MLVIRCARCRRKLFRYLKVGTGKVLYCYRDRMSKVDIVEEGGRVTCPCGNLIGIDEKKWIKMKQAAFTWSGSVTRK